MSFTSETARAANKRKMTGLNVDTVESQIAREKVARLNLKSQDVERWYITSPLANAPEEVKVAALKLELQIHPGPTSHLDEDGKQVQRESGTVILLEGEGVTTNKLWAEYLRGEWPELEVTKIPSSGLASYRQQIEEAKADLAEDAEAEGE